MKTTKLYRVISCLLIAMLVFCGNTNVQAETKEVEVIFADTIEEVELVPGTTTHVQVPVKTSAVDYMLSSVVANIAVTDTDGGKVSAFKVKNVELSRPGALEAQNSIVFYDTTYIDFDIVSKDTAGIGQYSVAISFNSMTGSYTANTLSIPAYVSMELDPAELTVTTYNYTKDLAIIGNSLELSLMIKNAGQIDAKNAKVTVDYGETGIKADYSTASLSIGNLGSGESAKLSLPIKILTDATKGTKTLTLKFSYKDAEGNSGSSETDLYVDVIANEAAPELTFSKVEFEGELLVGTDFNAVATLKNTGSSKASNVKVSVTDGVAADSIIPDYSTSSISAGTIKKGDSKDVIIPLTISKDAVKGTKAITLVVSYEDTKGVAYEQKTVIYPVVKANEEIEEKEGTPNIIISNVEQNPVTPSAGGQVTVSFDIENKGGIDVSEFKIGTSALTADTFSPVSSDPYIYMDELKTGVSKRISMSFQVSENIAEGYSTIPLEYSYKYGESNTVESKTATLNVLNIVNDLDDLSKSVPKLIISNYSTSLEDLRAGQTFTFNYDIQNTHNSVAAKNIKVTITQADNIFTVTSGSNSSYIESIAPGETQSCSIDLKVKSDATTKAYPLTIAMAYEYDGATESPVTGKVGEEVTETINLQAIENTRAEVENLYLDNWNTPTVGQSVLLYFQFYNMGKSTLSNVCATISGDFMKTDGEKQIIGNVEAGGSEYVEVDVTPLIEGDATGTVTITYEDSNGDELTMTQDFTSFIMGDTSMNMNMDMGMDYMDTMATVDTAKKPILPLWAFIAVQVGILIIITSVTRAIVIKRYKKKLEKTEEEA